MHDSLRQAAELMFGGEYERAAALCTPLRDDPVHRVDALHVLGVVRGAQGQVEQGLELLDEALRLRPGDVEIRFNRGNSLLKARRFEFAEQDFQAVLDARPEDAGALNNLGTCQFERGAPHEAIQSYRRAAKLQPGHAGAWQNLGQALLSIDQPEEALVALSQSLSVRPEHLETERALAESLLLLGRHAEARERLAKLSKRTPDRADVWQALSMACLRCEAPSDALKAIDAAIALDAGSTALHVNRGSVLVALGQGDDAVEAFRAALALDPQSVDARINLAQYQELANDVAGAEQTARQVLQTAPGNPMAQLTLARCLRRNGDVEGSLTILQSIDQKSASLDVAKSVEFELGATHEKLRDADAAWAHFKRANAIARRTPGSSFDAAKRYRDAIDRTTSIVDKHWASNWSTASPASRTPFFIVGFQRSGTTLLDTLIGSQSGFEILEEPRTLTRVVAAMKAYPEELGALDDANVNQLRAVYWDTVAALGFGAADFTVDKSPMGLIHAGLIYRLFPRARIVLALRHPYDVCLSCFMQDFALNAITAGFTSLRGVAEMYQRVMTLWQRYQELLGLNVHVVRYESLVADPRPVLDALAVFLGVTWEGGVDAHQDHARGRGLINTPSYHQVGEPIYDDAAWRWRRYEAHVAPVRDILAPFAERFGYPT